MTIITTVGHVLDQLGCQPFCMALDIVRLNLEGRPWLGHDRQMDRQTDGLDFLQMLRM